MLKYDEVSKKYLVLFKESLFLNIAFYKFFYTYFGCLYLCGKKSFVQKSEPYFIFARFGLRWRLVLQQ